MRLCLSPCLQAKRMDVVRPYLGQAVLDVGWGNARLARFLDNGVCYVGVELDETVVRRVAKCIPRAPFLCG